MKPGNCLCVYMYMHETMTVCQASNNSSISLFKHLNQYRKWLDAFSNNYLQLSLGKKRASCVVQLASSQPGPQIMTLPLVAGIVL